ncbi:hypothetical protein KP509_38G047100 [Ceratopteris richardii]|uniref:Uncharacterized protein n=1 Tax=Ceratopteris richardii TaxID=49495 RepID=A0A8T2Q3R2_CERRI|nr:hypothetical protein KP509_38G047100 [Ceratopteris richardii]KAH7278573.1 hypothetical protein KP509_38G047100 [Ceratopteris richardii]
MEASVTFRDEKCPLIRMKFPMTLAGFQLASGVALGDDQDLSVHVGTRSAACPSVKVSYQPNVLDSPISVRLKAGISPWGPPRAASLSVSAELRFSKTFTSPLFSVHVKPRLGDFNLRKMVRLATFGAQVDAFRVVQEGQNYGQRHIQIHTQSHNSSNTLSEPAHLLVASGEKDQPDVFNHREIPEGGTSDSHRLSNSIPHLTPIRLERGSLFTPIQPFNNLYDIVSEGADSVDNWGNDFVRIEKFDHYHRQDQEAEVILSNSNSEERTPNSNNPMEHQLRPESPLPTFRVGESEQVTPSALRALEASSVPWHLGADESKKGWILHAHSNLPLGSQTALKFKWGVNGLNDFSESLDRDFSSLRLPYLHLQKISLVVTDFAPDSHKQDVFAAGDQRLTMSQYDEIHELSPVASLCGSMKHQLELLHAENKVLRKAMEEMKARFESRRDDKFRKLAGNLLDMVAGESDGNALYDGKGGSRK